MKSILTRLCGVAMLAAGSLAEMAEAQQTQKPPTAEEAKAFVDDAEQKLLKLWIDASRADWVKSTYITDDTEVLAAQANEKAISAGVAYAKQATRFDGLKLSRRDGPEAQAPEARADASRRPRTRPRASRADAPGRGHGGHVRKGQVLPGRPDTCLTSRTSPRSWRRPATRRSSSRSGPAGTRSRPPCKPSFARYVELANKGARELGFEDTGAMWRSKYDMPPDAFAAEVDRLWEQVKPLYDSLHATCAGSSARSTATWSRPTARSRRTCSATCGRRTGTTSTRSSAPQDADPGYDLTEILKAKKTDADADGEVRRGLLHLARLRAAARDLLGALAVHEAAGPRGRLPRQRLGHRLRRRPAHQDVHRHHGRGLQRRSTTSSATTSTSAPTTSSRRSSATAPTTASTRRSATRSRSRSRPSTSCKLGLLDKAARPRRRTSACCSHRALDKVAFLPVRPAHRPVALEGLLRRDHAGRLQRGLVGAAPEVPGRRARRSRAREKDFDPGAKYHVPANVPYTRYFLADILQFQFHRALCEDRRLHGTAQPLLDLRQQGGGQAPGRRCSRWARAGRGPRRSRRLTGQREMDATAILDYFAPLQKWLDEQNKGKPVGW